MYTNKEDVARQIGPVDVSDIIKEGGVIARIFLELPEMIEDDRKLIG